jgi:hypothetical protein
MIMNRSTSLMLASFGLVLMIGAHGLVAWGGITLGGKIGQELGTGCLSTVPFSTLQCRPGPFR